MSMDMDVAFAVIAAACLVAAECILLGVLLMGAV